MIEFTRLLAKQVRSVFRKALGNRHADVRLSAGADGFRIQAQGFDHAAEYHEPTPRGAAELVVPQALLDDVQGSRSDPVVVSAPKKKLLTATWEERGVPRTMQYHRPKDAQASFPTAPSSFAENPPSLLTALRDAYDTTDPDSSRYALGCVQLRGKSGEISATDGRHLLLQSGYTFGFEDEVLVQNTRLFTGKELPQDQIVHVCKTEGHFVVRIGPWTFYLGLNKEGRFPRIEHVIPDYKRAQTTLELNSADAEFFLKNVSRLPGSADESAVTFDVNGSIAVRATSLDSPAPAEIVLTNSCKTGDDVTVCLDRRNLVRAAALGFERLYLFGKENALLARDDTRSYVWAVLHEQNGVPASSDCLRIESPVVARPTVSRTSSTPPTTAPMPTRNTTTLAEPLAPAEAPPAAAPTSEAASSVRRRRRTHNSSGSVLDQSIAVREQLRVALSSIKDLIRALQVEKRSQKSLKLALDSLKQLQTAA